MKDGGEASPDRSHDSDQRKETETASERLERNDGPGKTDEPSSGPGDGQQAHDDARQSSSGGGDPHPSPLERFRDKLDHGHEAVDKEHFQEAQRIYRSLIQEYRGLKHRDKLTDEDEQRLHTLYEKVDRAKE